MWHRCGSMWHRWQWTVASLLTSIAALMWFDVASMWHPNCTDSASMWRRWIDLASILSLMWHRCIDVASAIVDAVIQIMDDVHQNPASMWRRCGSDVSSMASRFSMWMIFHLCVVDRGIDVDRCGIVYAHRCGIVGIDVASMWHRCGIDLYRCGIDVASMKHRWDRCGIDVYRCIDVASM